MLRRIEDTIKEYRQGVIDRSTFKALMNPHTLGQPSNHDSELPIFASYIIAPDIWAGCEEDMAKLMQKNQMQLQVAIADCIDFGYKATWAISIVDDEFVRKYLERKSANNKSAVDTYDEKMVMMKELECQERFSFFGGALPSR